MAQIVIVATEKVSLFNGEFVCEASVEFISNNMNNIKCVSLNTSKILISYFITIFLFHYLHIL